MVVVTQLLKTFGVHGYVSSCSRLPGDKNKDLLRGGERGNQEANVEATENVLVIVKMREGGGAWVA